MSSKLADMLGTSDLVAFVPTADLARARQFYEKTLGLELVDESVLSCVFRAGAATLRVTAVAKVVPVPYTVLGWLVSDLVATIRELDLRGAAVVRYDGLEQDDVGIWRAPSGARVAWLRDPDGNTLSLTQLER